jgi:hypothetical protein
MSELVVRDDHESDVQRLAFLKRGNGSCGGSGGRQISSR